jgi:hypothetical protein
MTDDDQPDPAFDTFASRLVRREALRRAALELSTTTPAGLESALARISAEVTAEAVETKAHPGAVESAKGSGQPGSG